MRILVTTDQWFPDFRGGSARVATDTARALATRGHEVTVLAPRHPGQSAKTAAGSLTIRRELPRGLVPRTFSDPLHVRRIARCLSSNSFDILLAHQPSNMIGLLAARLRAPVALVFHASVPRELRFFCANAPFGKERIAATVMTPPLAVLERWAVRHATTILVLSEFSRSLVEADHPEGAGKTHLVPGGVDADAFSPGDGQEPARRRLGLASDEVILFTVRRLEPRMGLEPLLRAFSRISSSPGMRLAVAGSGMLEPELRRLADDLGIASRVDILGRVSDAALCDWYRAADLFVLPTVAYEGFGMATVEALASGTPVVGTAVGATPELLGPLDARLLASAATPEALATAISGALELVGPDFRSRCREYALSRYAWTRAILPWEVELEETVTSWSRLPGGRRR